MMMLGAKLTKTVMGLQEKLLQSEIITNRIDFSWLGIWGGGSGRGGEAAAEEDVLAELVVVEEEQRDLVSECLVWIEK